MPWEIETAAVLAPEARARVTSLIEGFDAEWSRFRPDSLVSRLAAGAASVPAPPDAAVLLDTYAALSEATAGAVDPLVGDVLARRGYDAGLSFVDGGAAPVTSGWRERLTWGGGVLALAEPATIDVGAIGKGRLVEIVLAALADVPGEVVVDASGDLAVRGGPAAIGLEHPYDPARAVGVWEVTDAALCASAVNRRAWGAGLHHILDARTGAPVRSCAASWALAPTAMRADAIATALFFDGGAELAHRWGVEWVRMTSDGRVEWSPGCTAELFL